MAMSKFSWGVLSGVALGVLFAPGKGAKTRKTVVHAAVGLKSRIQHLFRNEEDELEELRRVLADEHMILTDADRKKLVQLIENNQQVLRELDM